MENKNMLDTIKAVILGHAVGDALGVPVEFASRAELDDEPVTDMTGFGTYPVPAGSWSDDTSMSLCALDVLADNAYDLEKIMENFGKWYDEDAFTPTGETFDVGNTCSFAIENYFAGSANVDHCGLTGEQNNGNGSLMRIAPFALYLYYHRDSLTASEMLDRIHRASALTHAHERSKVGCGLYSMILWHLLSDKDKRTVYTGLRRAVSFYGENPQLRYYERMLSFDFEKLRREEIRSSGYVVDTLEAAVWCLLTTDSYRECVLKAVNLGDDTDTVAAVAGSLAGALYGYEAIPKEWLEKLQGRDYIEKMCERAAENWGK